MSEYPAWRVSGLTAISEGESVKSDHKLLYVPGPIEVNEDVRQVCARPMIGHRTNDFRKLYASIKPGLKKLLYTENAVMVSTSSGSGLMEAAMRNLVRERVLNCVNGAFSQKWYDIAIACGKSAEKLEVEAGKAIKPDMLDAKLSGGGFDAVCVTHNETSTGVMNDLLELSGVMKKYPDVMFLVDSISSMAGAKIEVDRFGIDMCIGSSQKAFGLPPGISFASVSERALKKAEGIKGRGSYFDLVDFKKSYDKDETPSTPAVSFMYGLDYQLKKFLAEGLDARWDRHKRLARTTHAWVKKMGFQLFAEPGYESVTVSCVVDAPGADLKKMQEMMGEKGFAVDKGYTKLNEKLVAAGKKPTFRIPHMGDMTDEELSELLSAFEEVFGNL